MSKQHPNLRKLRDLRGLPDIERNAVMSWAIRVCENADNLVNVKGRHHAEVAYRRLEEAVNSAEATCSK